MARDKTETHQNYKDGMEHCPDCGATGNTIVLYSCRRCKLHAASIAANEKRRLPDGHDLVSLDT